MKIIITLTEEMLGTKPSNPDIFKDWVAPKYPTGVPQADELANAEQGRAL